MKFYPYIFTHRSAGTLSFCRPLVLVTLDGPFMADAPGVALVDHERVLGAFQRAESVIAVEAMRSQGTFSAFLLAKGDRGVLRDDIVPPCAQSGFCSPTEKEPTRPKSVF